MFSDLVVCVQKKECFKFCRKALNSFQNSKMEPEKKVKLEERFCTICYGDVSGEVVVCPCADHWMCAVHMQDPDFNKKCPVCKTPMDLLKPQEHNLLDDTPALHVDRSIMLQLMRMPDITLEQMNKWFTRSIWSDQFYYDQEFEQVQEAALSSDRNWAFFWVVMVSIWAHMGFYTLILLAGLQAIPKDVYEAAEMDAASPMRVLFRITLPLLMPNLIVVLVLVMIRAVQTFDEVFVLTGGGPGSATTFIVQYIYLTGFAEQIHLYGLAAAASLILAIGLMTLTLAQLRLSKASEAGKLKK